MKEKNFKEENRDFYRVLLGCCSLFLSFWLFFRYYVDNTWFVLVSVWVCVLIGCIVAPFLVLRRFKFQSRVLKNAKLFSTFSVAFLIIVLVTLMGQARLDRQAYENTFKDVEITDENLNGNYYVVSVDVPLTDYLIDFNRKGLKDSVKVKESVIKIVDGTYIEKNSDGINVEGTYVLKDDKMIVTVGSQETVFKVRLREGLLKNGEGVTVIDLYNNYSSLTDALFQEEGFLDISDGSKFKDLYLSAVDTGR